MFFSIWNFLVHSVKNPHDEYREVARKMSGYTAVFEVDMAHILKFN
jgi:hypothetical protein